MYLQLSPESRRAPERRPSAITRREALASIGLLGISLATLVQAVLRPRHTDIEMIDDDIPCWFEGLEDGSPLIGQTFFVYIETREGPEQVHCRFVQGPKGISLELTHGTGDKRLFWIDRRFPVDGTDRYGGELVQSIRKHRGGLLLISQHLPMLGTVKCVVAEQTFRLLLRDCAEQRGEKVYRDVPCTISVPCELKRTYALPFGMHISGHSNIVDTVSG